MHDLVVSSAGLPAGAGSACLFGLSLCAGAGGLDLGLAIACPRYRTVGYVERDAFAASIIVARMEDAALDHAPLWDDIASFDGRPWRGAVDIVTAGYPCQPFSVAGKRRGADDPRHLWPHVARIIDEVEPPFVFLEMSPIISASASPKSPQDWSAWATGLRQASSRRRKSVRPIGASGCSSSPSARGTSWPTPRACSGIRSSGGNRTEMLRLWPTPMATDGCKPSAGNRRAADLTHAGALWMTPTARDHKDGATSLANTPVNGLLGRQVLVTPMAGETFCDTPRTLNPLFVEALMGWPTGWTGFASVATAWCPWLQRMRSELSQLSCWPMGEAA